MRSARFDSRKCVYDYSLDLGPVLSSFASRTVPIAVNGLLWRMIGGTWPGGRCVNFPVQGRSRCLQSLVELFDASCTSGVTSQLHPVRQYIDAGPYHDDEVATHDETSTTSGKPCFGDYLSGSPTLTDMRNG